MKNGKIVIKDRNIIYIIFLITPFIEMINSVILMNTGGESFVGKFFRIIIIAFLMYIMIKYKLSLRHAISVVVFVVFSGLSYCVCVIYEKGYAVDKLYNLLKYVLPMLFMVVLCTLYKNKVIENDYARNIFDIYSLILPLIYFIPLFLGIGYYNYEGNRGYKGLNYMINDINIIVAVITIYAAQNFFEKKTMKNLMIFLLNFFSLVYMQTKTSMLCILILVAVFYINMTKGRMSIYKYIVFTILLIFLLWMLLTLFRSRTDEYFARVVYLFNDAARRGDSFWSAFSSTRTDRLKIFDKLYDLSTVDGLRSLFFGVPMGKTVDIEMDFFNVLLLYGLIPCIYLFFYYVRFVRHAFVNFMKNRLPRNAIDLVVILLMLFFASFAGHVLMSAYSGVFMVLVCFNILYNEKG